MDLNEKEIRFDPENTIRIALLHHHPVANWKGEQAQQSIWTRPIANIFKAANEEGMKLNGADKFLKGCFDADIKLILFGHQHYPYQRAVVSNGKCLRTFCCPTTLELSKYGNGFYLFDFLNRDEFSMDFYFSHLSNKNLPKGFSRISEKSGTFKFTELSDEERESAYNL